MFPPTSLQDRLVRLPIQRIFPPFHAASVTVRSEGEPAIPWSSDPQSIGVAQRLVEGDGTRAGRFLVPEREEETLDFELSGMRAGFELSFAPATFSVEVRKGSRP